VHRPGFNRPPDDDRPDQPAPRRTSVRDWFHTFAQGVASVVGSPWAFGLAVVLVVAWAVSGPVFKFSESWQLVINTATTIITFLMVFVIQNTQNRDARAMHLKLDELIRAVRGARNRLVDLSDEELDRLQKEFEQLRNQVARSRRPGSTDPAA
jgi:low affinity Fe/Cu permease